MYDGDWIAKTEHTGATLRNCRCEHCGKHYHYAILATAAGSSVSGDKETAVYRAHQRADAAVRAGFSRVEIVPCPMCGWLQKEIFRELQLRRIRWTRRIATICFFIAGICCIVMPMPTLFTPSRELDPGDWPRLIHRIEMISIPAVSLGVAVLIA